MIRVRRCSIRRLLSAFIGRVPTRSGLHIGYRKLAELHADLFRRHASPLEDCVLWRSTTEVKMLCPTRFVVDATETVKKEAWRTKCGAPRLGYEQNQKATYYCSYVGCQNEITFVGGISERPKSEIEVLNEEARVAASY